MRTDPRADEVRTIVERVFSSFLSSAQFSVFSFQAKPRQAPQRFPRLYGPDGEAADETPMEHGSRPSFASRSRFSGHPCSVRVPSVATYEGQSLEIDETIVIDDGQYVARSYRIEGYLAMWLLAAGIVQFYDSQGRMLATVNLFKTLRPKRMAA